MPWVPCEVAVRERGRGAVEAMSGVGHAGHVSHTPGPVPHCEQPSPAIGTRQGGLGFGFGVRVVWGVKGRLYHSRGGLISTV